MEMHKKYFLSRGEELNAPYSEIPVPSPYNKSSIYLIFCYSLAIQALTVLRLQVSNVTEALS